MNIIKQLVTDNTTTTADPATESAIQAVSRLLDAPVPRTLMELWRVSDGLFFDSLDCHVPGTSEAIQLIEEGAWFDFSRRGLLPILDDHQSNFLAVFVRGPRAFRVAYLPHDDGSRLIYRDIESCFRGILQSVGGPEDADSILHDSPGDYLADGSRSEEDQHAAKALLAAPHELDEWNHAVQLLDATSLSEWRRVLETDHFVRRDARARMKSMSSSAIQELLAEDQREFDEFASFITESARAAGFKVGRRSADALQIGRMWINLDGFFHRRKIPQALTRILWWIEDLAAGRDPHLRPGHYHTD